MEYKKRLLVFVVAYNAENTIRSVLNRIPVSLSEKFEISILVIDDCSSDETYERAVFEKKENQYPFPLTVLFNPINQGYGGNQKIGYHYAIKEGYDYVAMIHGDGQYAPELLPDIMGQFGNETGAVFGSRMINKRDALKGGMPRYKFYGNQILTQIQNLLLGSSLSEFHSGYRVYSVDALKKIPFDLNDNDFHFDTEIIIQFLFENFEIREHPIPTFYGDEICHVNGVKYAWDILIQTMIARLQRFHILYDAKYDCVESEKTPNYFQRKRLKFRTPEKWILDFCHSQDRLILVGEEADSLVDSLQAKGVSVNHFVSAEDFNEEILKQNQQELDHVVLLDGVGVFNDDLSLLLNLRNYLSGSSKTKLHLVSANLGFVLIRLRLLFGRFNYSRRGILSKRSSTHYTLTNLKKLVLKSGFSIDEVQGFRVPFELIMENGLILKIVCKIASALNFLSAGLFGYQIVISATCKESLESLLKDAFVAASIRGKGSE